MRNLDQQKNYDAILKPSASSVHASNRGVSSRKISHNYGLETNPLGENKNLANYSQKPTAKIGSKLEFGGLAKKEARSSQNKFTYGAGPLKTEV